MLDLKFIREHSDEVQRAIQAKGLKLSLAEILELDTQRRERLQESDRLKEERNRSNDDITRLKKEGKPVTAVIEKTRLLSQRIKELDEKVAQVEEKLQPALLLVPNLPDPAVPVGADPSCNRVVREWGKPPSFSFQPKDHLTLAAASGWIDFERASRMTGHGFALYQGMGARLERGLINFMLDLHTKKHGYREVSPPFLVNRQSMTGTGQLPKLEEDMYRLRDEDYFLVPTAEVPVTNIHRGEVLEESELPICYAAYTPCFRREAGSYGKDTKGLIRVHQFDKVELVKFTTPETSAEEHEKLVNDAEKVLQLLELPYRVVLLCTGDLSFAAAKCYDLEVWAPGTGRWLEVSSCSNFTDFQARRANIRYRTQADKKQRYVHTLNGSGVALARTVIGLLENHQRADGTIFIPAALQPYLQ